MGRGQGPRAPRPPAGRRPALTSRLGSAAARGYGPGMAERLVVIGGDAAGMSAASGVRRAQPGTEVVVLEKGGRTSYAACGIPFFVSGDVDDVESLVARTPEEFEAQGIQVRMHTEALGLDLDARTVQARDLDSGAVDTIGFDRLMLGTGARPTVPPWPGVDLPHVSVAHTLLDASRLDELAARCGDGRVVVIGGGYIGIEMAEAFLARGAQRHDPRHRPDAAAQPRPRDVREGGRRCRTTRNRAPLRGARRGHHGDDRGGGRDGVARRRRRARPRGDAEQRAGRGRRPHDRGAQRHLRRRPPAHLGRGRLLGGRLCRVAAPDHRRSRRGSRSGRWRTRRAASPA